MIPLWTQTVKWKTVLQPVNALREIWGITCVFSSGYLFCLMAFKWRPCLSEFSQKLLFYTRTLQHCLLHSLSELYKYREVFNSLGLITSTYHPAITSVRGCRLFSFSFFDSSLKRGQKRSDSRSDRRMWTLKLWNLSNPAALPKRDKRDLNGPHQSLLNHSNTAKGWRRKRSLL